MLDICEKGVSERREGGYGDKAVRVDVALMLGAAAIGVAVVAAVKEELVVVVVLEPFSVREVDAEVEVEPRVSLPCVVWKRATVDFNGAAGGGCGEDPE